MSATFTLADIMALYGKGRDGARAMFADRGGPLPKIHGHVLRTPAQAVLDDLRLSRADAAAILNPRTEGEAA